LLIYISGCTGHGIILDIILEFPWRDDTKPGNNITIILDNVYCLGFPQTYLMDFTCAYRGVGIVVL